MVRVDIAYNVVRDIEYGQNSMSEIKTLAHKMERSPAERMTRAWAAREPEGCRERHRVHSGKTSSTPGHRACCSATPARSKTREILFKLSISVSRKLRKSFAGGFRGGSTNRPLPRGSGLLFFMSIRAPRPPHPRRPDTCLGIECTWSQGVSVE